VDILKPKKNGQQQHITGLSGTFIHSLHITTYQLNDWMLEVKFKTKRNGAIDIRITQTSNLVQIKQNIT